MPASPIAFWIAMTSIFAGGAKLKIPDTAQLDDRHAEARLKLDGAHSNETDASLERFRKIRESPLFVLAKLGRRKHDDLELVKLRRALPGGDVRRELTVENNDAVTFSPWKTKRHFDKPLRGARNEGKIFGASPDE